MAVGGGFGGGGGDVQNGASWLWHPIVQNALPVPLVVIVDVSAGADCRNVTTGSGSVAHGDNNGGARSSANDVIDGCSCTKDGFGGVAHRASHGETISGTSVDSDWRWMLR